MYEPQLSDFVRFWCIFCMVSFTRRVRIAGGMFWCAAPCNSVNRTCSTSTLFFRYARLRRQAHLLCIPKSQLSRLQQIQDSLARTVMKAPKSCHITHILRSLHWRRITERIEYKLLSLTYKVFTTTRPPYLHNLISIQRPRCMRSSSVVTLARTATFIILPKNN